MGKFSLTSSGQAHSLADSRPTAIRHLYNRSALFRRAVFPLVKARRLWRARHAGWTRHVFTRLADALAEDPVIKVAGFPGTYAFGSRSDSFRNVVMAGSYEADLAVLCADRVDASRDAIDVGANIGLYSVLLASLLPSRRVLAIEPTPDAANRLRRNIARNGFAENTIVFDGVAADHNGKMEIRVVPGREEYSSCGQMTHAAISGVPHVVLTVEAATIDDLVRRHALDPGFVKLDVEGMEHVVIGGMRDVLSRFRPVILTEISDALLRSNGSSSAALVDLIRSFDYQLFETSGQEIREGSGLNGEMVCIPMSGVSK